MSAPRYPVMGLTAIINWNVINNQPGSGRLGCADRGGSSLSDSGITWYTHPPKRQPAENHFLHQVSTIPHEQEGLTLPLYAPREHSKTLSSCLSKKAHSYVVHICHRDIWQASLWSVVGVLSSPSWCGLNRKMRSTRYHLQKKWCIIAIMRIICSMLNWGH